MSKIISYSGIPTQKPIKKITPADIECTRISIAIGFIGTVHFSDGTVDQTPQVFKLDIPVDIIVTPELGQIILAAIEQAVKEEIKEK